MREMPGRRKEKGITLIELMVAVAIIGVLFAIAIPTYTGYIETSRQSVMVESMASIRLFEEEARLSGTPPVYVPGTYDPSDPNAAGGLKAKLGWSPGTSDDQITYVVYDATATGYKITATHSAGTVVERVCVLHGACKDPSL